MKKIPVESAVGMELCHDITAMRDGFKGAAFKRGHIITEEDVPKLLDIGKKNVFVWEDNAGEIHEEEAALRMAAMVPVEGVPAPQKAKCFSLPTVLGCSAWTQNFSGKSMQSGILPSALCGITILWRRGQGSLPCGLCLL